MLDDLAEELSRIGLQAGLDAVGFAGAEPFELARAVIERRSREGLADSMQFTYRNPARATDPSRSLPGAAALVVGARRYLRQDPAADPSTPEKPTPDGPASVPARVARYSWVDHYQPLRQALRRIAERLEDGGFATRVLVDDNALVDRAAAHRAGLGWFGRNTNLLLPGAGSWFVLGSVVTDAPLPSGHPVTESCGSCRRCVPACPTGALSEDGALDARRCLAWLVQAPGPFPVEHREALGDRIYGCDTCQEVCPVNRRAERSDPPVPAEVGATATADALDLLRSSDEQLLARWGRWYIAERDPRYLRRNALIVLGNVADRHDPAVLRALRASLRSEDPLLRGHAVWAAARVGCAELAGELADDPDPFVASEVARVGSVTARSGSVRALPDKLTVDPHPPFLT